MRFAFVLLLFSGCSSALTKTTPEVVTKPVIRSEVPTTSKDFRDGDLNPTPGKPLIHIPRPDWDQ